VASAIKTTIWYALAANGSIAVAKAAAGAITGPAAVLAKAAHSLADTANQVLLFISLSLGRRSPDEQHPFDQPDVTKVFADPTPVGSAGARA